MNTLTRSGACLLAGVASLTPAVVARQDLAQILADPESGPMQALRAMAIPEGFESALWAAEPMVMDPVAFCIDEQGRLFVAESFRQERGVEDNRAQPYWLLDDLSSETVQDRLDMLRKWAHKRPNGMAHYTDYEDRVRLIVDMTGDGHADAAYVFADGFNEPLDGTAAGLIARDGDVYLTNIPSLWLLQDRNGDFRADFKAALHTGFGVRTALRGHDMHGLVWGPDGRLYWSIGDRGYHVTLPDGRVLSSPDAGAVFRCNPDGTELEVVHHGLRNPQELAFDQYGNLFTGDNNSDAGDRARLVYIVEGGETGWSMNYQTLDDPNQRGPWNQEGIWELRHDAQPAWTLPPIAHVTSGPSGFVYYPGVGLPARYAGHFFLCDFRGGNDSSSIVSFAVEPDGAGFRMIDQHIFASHVLATDVDFGYDGKMYISDWGAGWVGNEEGRIYTVWHPEARAHPTVREVEELFRAGFKHRSNRELATLLEHVDMRVRLRAQFALADRGAPAVPLLSEIAHSSRSQLARLHAIWALGMIARASGRQASDPGHPLEQIADLLQDDDAEVRAQTARTMGDVRFSPAGDALQLALADESPRVKYFAALALGRLQHRAAIDDLMTLLWDNDNRDVYLRHAAVMALYWMDDLDTVLSYIADESAAIRLAVLLVLRRAGDARLADFLADEDELLVTEAARAINDLPIDSATPALAAVLQPATAEMLSVAEAAASEHRFTRHWHHNAKRGVLAGSPAWSIVEQLAQIDFSGKTPDASDQSSILEGKSNVADDFVTRIVGTIVAPQSGDYTFELASDDDSILYLSSDESRANLSRVAAVEGWVGRNQWDQKPSQRSAPIRLEAGKRYAIEVRHYEGAGEDHVAVGWVRPDGSAERPIGGGVQVEGNEALLRRAINANFRLGQASNASVLADLARNPDVPISMRLEAMDALADWVQPPPRDRVNGSYRPLDPSGRSAASIVPVLERTLPGLIDYAAAPVASAARRLASQYDVQLDNTANLRDALDASLPDADRGQALLQLSRDRNESFEEAMAAALASDRPGLRALARDVLARVDPNRAQAAFISALEGGTILEQQAALRGLAGFESAEAAHAIAEVATRLQRGTLPRELHLDAIEAVHTHRSPLLNSHRRSLPINAEALLFGGSAEAGRAVFTRSSAVSCQRCHSIDGQGGEAGPDLAGVASRLTREQLLQSMLDPNAVLSDGFDPPSAMIPVAEHLSRREIRDLVEYLTTLDSD